VSGSQVVKAQLTATYGDGCQQTVVSEIPVQVFAPPVLASQVSACGSNEVVALNPGGDPTYTYLWSGPNLDNPNAVNPLVTIDATSTYNVVITAQNGCSATQSIQVALPSEALTIAPLDNIIACDNAPVTLTAHANQPNISFTWSTDNDFDFTIGTDQSLTVFSGTQPITYYVMGTNPNGCTAMTSLTVQNAAVDVDFDDAFEVCKGDHLDLKVDLDGITADDFTNWFPFNPLTAPLYKNQTFNFEVTNGFGCTGSGELTVKVVEFTDSLDIIAEPAEVWAGQSTQLTVTENPGYDYSWSPLLGLSDPFGPNPVVTPEGTTTYLVEVTDLATGCRTQKKIEVKVKDIICDEPYIFIPNVFTPNGDGVNDMLKVEGFNIDELYLAIYDRWGEKVFETSSKEEGWDGAFRGTTVSGDVYGFYLKVSCPGGREFFKKGNITVLR
jgi:gliding motility-associated-like protein